MGVCYISVSFSSRPNDNPLQHCFFLLLAGDYLGRMLHVVDGLMFSRLLRISLRWKRIRRHSEMKFLSCLHIEHSVWDDLPSSYGVSVRGLNLECPCRRHCRVWCRVTPLSYRCLTSSLSHTAQYQGTQLNHWSTGNDLYSVN